MTQSINTLGDALPAKMKEIREEFIPAYQSIGPAGAMAIALMQQELSKAERAMSEGDVIAMIRAYETLNEFKL